MLELKKITKSYTTESFQQVALNDVSIAFRKTEFVSILGPSGSGKTTLLNIIGGLDKYDDGDIIIGGISTKEYSDRDWDTYRNHAIGFVFQNYNLISHQTVLANVELALMLAGVSKKERRRRAVAALERVGLKEHMKKKPNQLSGGQMQRVAIARALINNPEIILADEPTGALDTETSVQIMALLKEISKEKLVIMVTHNPDLAVEYSTRIVKVQDGKIISDSNPFDADNSHKSEKPKKQTAMSFKTALSLSYNNLLTKKGRTLLTAFAGSIGIIGIALILSISTGVKDYINYIQTNVLASAPLVFEEEVTDSSSILQLIMPTMDAVEDEDEEDSSKENQVQGNPQMYKTMRDLLNIEKKSNNLSDFKMFIENNRTEFDENAQTIQYTYPIKFSIYAKDPDGQYIEGDFGALLQGIVGANDMMSGIATMMESFADTNVWGELMFDPKTNEIAPIVSNGYDIVYGQWPSAANEALLVLNNNNEITDMTLYALGLVDRQTMTNSTIAAMAGKEDTSWEDYDKKSWTYEEICNIPLKVVFAVDKYSKDPETSNWKDVSDNKTLMNSVIGESMDMKIVGIIRPKDDDSTKLLSYSLYYTPALVDYGIEKTQNAQIVKDQLEEENKNVISGLPFSITDPLDVANKDKPAVFKEHVVGLTNLEKANLYKDILSVPSEKFIKETVDSLLADYRDKSEEEIVDDVVKTYANDFGFSEDLVRDMLSGYEKDSLIALLEETVREMIVTQYADNAQKTIEEISSQPSADELQTIKDMLLLEIYGELGEMPEEYLDAAKQQLWSNMVAQNWADTTGMPIDSAMTVVSGMTQEDISIAFDNCITEMAIDMYAEYGAMASGEDKNAKIATAFDEYLAACLDEDLVYLYDNFMPDKVSDMTKDDILKTLGYVTEDAPNGIVIYPIDFNAKEAIVDLIERYNDTRENDDKLTYEDIAAIIISPVSNVITAISAVLACFVAVSLIVSSIMIGIITYISVLERTKEIGILRAVGASKKDIRRVFNAETAIIGFLAGTIGLLITIMACIPISIAARAITDIQTLTAHLPWPGYLLLILSIGLTLIAGLIPSSVAAKKDPVIALRNE